MCKINEKVKTIVTLSVNKKLNNYMNKLFSNKYRCIEWLIYQDLVKENKDIKKIII